MWLISLVAVIACSYFLASMTASLVAIKFQDQLAMPPLKSGGSKTTLKDKPVEEEAYKPILERNVFDSRAVGVATPGNLPAQVPEQQSTPSNGGEPVLTTLPIKLLSTFSVGLGLDGRSSCSISAGANKQDVYTVNDKKQFAPDTKITRILYDRVEFTNKGRPEYVMLEDFTKGKVSLTRPTTPGVTPPVLEPVAENAPTKIEQTAEGKFVIDRAEIDEAVANLDKLYTQVRAVPHFKDGNPDGLKLLSVKPGSLFAKLGLKRGDILKKINGNDLDIKKGLELFNQLKNENQITLDVERQGAPQSMEYEIR